MNILHPFEIPQGQVRPVQANHQDRLQGRDPIILHAGVVLTEEDIAMLEYDRLAGAGCVTCGAPITKSKHRTGMHCYKHDWNLKNLHRESQRRYLQTERGRATQARYLAQRGGHAQANNNNPGNNNNGDANNNEPNNQ